ncbi:MAG TPA: MBL fold metallo-hydrolase [Thermomicrobiales bacterium]|jgi:glyoxylase-like metal-dependent hydrolase (beta-lactamase superfamily II)|nr:MBL fold metallo-hydrolase [Thermomicrobiales bacterium]
MTGDIAELVQDWFSVTRLEPGVTMIGEPLHSEDPKSFLVEGTDRAVLLDTGIGVGDIGALVRDLTDRPVTVVTTHAHWDHVGGNRHFRDVLAPIGAHAALEAGWSDERMARALAESECSGPLPAGTERERAGIPPQAPTGSVTEGDVLDLGGRSLEVLAAPGHCPELIVLVDRANGILFGTDAVYAAGLYAQSDESDLPTYLATLRRLVALVPELRVVYSSHGTVPFEPGLIVEMERGMVDVMAGRQAERHAFGGQYHDFGRFGIIVPG